MGAEYEKGTLWSNIIVSEKQGMAKSAVYANDTITFGKLSLTPGLRYDDTDTNGDFLSPSLGITYELGKKTLLRANVARGFGIPPLSFTFYKEVAGWRGNPDLKVEKVTSYQLGMETGLLEYVWLKITAFRHDITDGLIPEEVSPGIWSYVNRDKLRRQGIELEMKTVPVYNMILHAGASFIEAKNSVTGEVIKDVPTSSYVVGLQYDDKKSFRALLQGKYIWWNDEAWHLAKYSAMIVDLNMIKTVYQGKASKVDLFLTGHNIFNGSQYWDSWYKNAARWVEAGVRFKF
jgi:vitamin B12 transporter